MLFDSHAHYDDVRFDEADENGTVLREKLISEMASVDENAPEKVARILNAGTNLRTSREAIKLAEKYPFFYASVGIHPEDIENLPDEPETVIDDIAELLKHPKTVAIGEIGLDYHWEGFDKEKQIRYFRAQMTLAKNMGYPVIIHDRDAHGDVMNIVYEYPTVKGIFHSFSGSVEMAKELLKRGWYISFSGVITFKNATRIAEVVRMIPDDRILVETDCPYLAPVPHRGCTNYSAYVRFSAEKAAELRGVDYADFARQTYENANRVFRIE